MTCGPCEALAGLAGAVFAGFSGGRRWTWEHRSSSSIAAVVIGGTFVAGGREED